MDSQSANIAFGQGTTKNAYFEDACLQEPQDLFFYENRARDSGFHTIAGVDEAGRGPLAGPVVIAACILPKDFPITGLKDSKLLTEKKREEFFALLTQRNDVVYALCILDHEEIDRLNILQATLQGMQKALKKLKKLPDFVLIDGNVAPSIPFPCRTIVDGDKKSASIAAASILAKVTRDHLMRKLDKKYPSWNFLKHKGYATKDHLERLKQFGVSPIHRKSFAPVRLLLQRSNFPHEKSFEQMDWDMLNPVDTG